jgi:hypothetical protein
MEGKANLPVSSSPEIINIVNFNNKLIDNKLSAQLVPYGGISPKGIPTEQIITLAHQLNMPLP